MRGKYDIINLERIVERMIEMALLDSNIVEQLKGYFNNINGNIEMVAFLDESDKSKELDSFLQEVDGISSKVNYTKKTFGEDVELE